MKEYIFRGKRVKDGAWVEGSLLTVRISDRCAYLIFGSEFRLDGEDVKSMSHAAVVFDDAALLRGDLND